MKTDPLQIGIDGEAAVLSGLTYRDAGVDIGAATAALVKIRKHAESTFPSPGVANPVGHFGGVYRLQGSGERLLVASADGIGTKIRIAIVAGGDAHAGVAADLVNHCVNDILACGAKPLFFLDYIAMGKLDPFVLERLVAGMAAACRENGVALIGGETAEMPGIYAESDYDVAGFIVGEVSPQEFVDGNRVAVGDSLIGLPALGLHTNGYSLARRILGLSGDASGDRKILASTLPGGDGVSIGESLLAPHPGYLNQVQPLLVGGLVHGMAHITGGGLIDNLPRMLPAGMVAQLDSATWEINPLQRYLVEQGRLSWPERYQVFNMGIGFVLAVGAEAAAPVAAAIPGARVIGCVRERQGDEPRVAGLFAEPANPEGRSSVGAS